MFCTNCGKKSEGNQKFCTSCGGALSAETKKEKEVPKTQVPLSASTESSWNVGRIITILIILAVVGFGIYGSLDENSITTNNEGITSFDSGDSEQAIRQFQQASQEAEGTDTKLNTLKNLGYVYSSEGQYEQALQAFREALTYTSAGSFENYLVAGEIALLEGKPNAAQISYNKAYELNSNDFQINNALNLFYLDLESVAPNYVNYPKALTHAQKAFDVSTSDIKNIATQNLAIAHFFNENYDRTISLLSPQGSDPYIAYWLGWSYAIKEDEANARFYFQRAVDGGVEVEQEVYDYLYSY
jgi:tetratricopeptide (TPR) repeat protein